MPGRWRGRRATPTASWPPSLGTSTDLVVRVFGGDPGAAKEQPGAEELRDLVAGQHGLSAEQRTIMTGALEITERTLRSVLRPRPQVFMLGADLPVREARTALAASGHSRAPVVAARHVDDIVGVAHLRELITTEDGLPVRDACRPALTFPESLRVRISRVPGRPAPSGDGPAGTDWA